MDKEKAYEILSEHLGPDYYIVGRDDKIDDIFLFFVKEMRYKDDDFVLSITYGVNSSGKVFDCDDINKYLDEKEIG